MDTPEEVMYQTPRLTRFGTFRELTQQGPIYGKSIVGDDLVPGIGMDCNPNPPSSNPEYGCRS